MANRYFCGDGSRVSQAEIDKRRKEAYLKYDDGTRYCRGCGGQAQDRSHIIAQARCKSLRHTEYIWQPWNWFLACRRCHQIWEAYKGEQITILHNYWECLAILKKYDKEGYMKYVTFGHTPTLE